MKNNYKYALVVFLLSFTVGIHAQTIFKGKVIDADTRQPISNAKVGISDQGVGELTDTSGRFVYKKYHEVLRSESTLLVGASGYESIQLGVNEIRSLFNTSSTIELSSSKETKRDKKIKKLSIFWDISEGMQGRDVESEIAYIQQFTAPYKRLDITLVAFNHKIQKKETFEVRNGDLSRFRESVTSLVYNGPSNYGVLEIKDTDAVILSSKGGSNFGTLNVSQDIPIYAIATGREIDTGYLQKLARYTSGNFQIIKKGNIPVANTNTISKDERVSVTSQSNGPVIKGKITSLGKPLQEVSIIKKGDFTEYLTDASGRFEVPASEGDILQLRYLGMFPKDIRIDNNKDLVIELLPENDVLDEVVLTKKIEEVIVGNKIIKGNINHPSIPGGTTALGDFYITADDITPDAKTLEYVLQEKFKGVVITQDPFRGTIVTIQGREPGYIINGRQLFRGEPIPLYILDNEIESIIVKDSPFLTSRYGLPISDLFVIITTKTMPLSKAKRKTSLLVKGNDYTEEVQSISEGVLKTKSQIKITGKITSVGKPIQGATISKKGTFEEYTSKSDGSFEIYAQKGDELIVQYLGMYPKGFMIDEATTYDIDLLPKNDVLDEVVLKGENRDGKDETIRTAWGEENRDKVGYDVKVIKKEDIGDHQIDLANVINGKFAGISAIDDPYFGLTVVGRSNAMTIVIDGLIIPSDIPRPFISPDRVESISIIKSIIGTTRYGTLGKNGVVEITTRALLNTQGVTTEAPSALVEGNDYNEEVQSIDTPVQSNDRLQVRGIVKGPQGVLSDATITRKGSFDEVYTNNKGEFEIQAALDDVLVVSKVGMFAKELLVTSQDIGSVELTPKNDNLDEVIVQGNRRVDNTIETGYGKENSDKLGYAVDELTSDSFSAGATNLQQLITGKVAGVTVAGGLYSGSEVVYKIRGGNQSITNEIPPIWIVNGTPYQEVPNFLDVQQIESISVLKSVVATSRYGSLAAGGAFLIKTKESSFKDKAAAAQKSALVSGNEYDGASTRSLDAALPEYILRLREIPSIEDQFEHYQKIARTQESPLEFYVDVAQYFEGIDRRKADQVRADLAYISRNNTKALRTLGYIYSAVGDYKNAELIYERVAKIAPQEAQSYRDLALIYQETGQYNRALELYYNMLGEQIKGVDFKGLENVLRSELSHLVSLYKDKIDYERLPNEWLRIDFDVDIRMVIEWSDRSVPFEFQFVNPDKKFFKWTHTLEDNRERLEREQSQGFQSEEFIIDDAPSGEWLINIQYLGDEGDYVLPPFLKYTVYRNYGTPQETKEIKVVKLFKQSDKVTLGKVVL